MWAWIIVFFQLQNVKGNKLGTQNKKIKNEISIKKMIIFMILMVKFYLKN